MDVRMMMIIIIIKMILSCVKPREIRYNSKTKREVTTDKEYFVKYFKLQFFLFDKTTLYINIKLTGPSKSVGQSHVHCAASPPLPPPPVVDRTHVP